MRVACGLRVVTSGGRAVVVAISISFCCFALAFASLVVIPGGNLLLLLHLLIWLSFPKGICVCFCVSFCSWRCLIYAVILSEAKDPCISLCPCHCLLTCHSERSRGICGCLFLPVAASASLFVIPEGNLLVALTRPSYRPQQHPKGQSIKQQALGLKARPIPA